MPDLMTCFYCGPHRTQVVELQPSLLATITASFSNPHQHARSYFGPSCQCCYGSATVQAVFGQ